MRTQAVDQEKLPQALANIDATNIHHRFTPTIDQSLNPQAVQIAKNDPAQAFGKSTQPMS